MDRISQALRNAEFLTRQRMFAWSLALLIGFVAALLFMVLSAHGLNDYKGRPLGSDFSNIYAAGTYVRESKASAPFDLARQYAREQTIFGHATPFFGWHYPPYFLLVAGLLAGLPYIAALLAWQLSTLLAYLGGLAALLRKTAAPKLANNPLWLLLAIAFPAVFVNLIHGHNGFLTAALISGGMALLDVQPVAGGMLLGLLAYKPQFFLVVPVLLAAGGRWRALIAMSATVIALTTVVTALFGVEVWSAFLGSTHFTRTVVLEQGNTGFYKIQSVFAWVRMWGGSIPLAYTFQTLAAGAALLVGSVIWRYQATFADRTAVLCVAALLCTPYCLDYDLMILAPAIAILAAHGIAAGFRPYEKSLLAALWLAPILARGIAYTTSIPVGVFLLLAALTFFAMAAFREKGNASVQRPREQIGRQSQLATGSNFGVT